MTDTVHEEGECRMRCIWSDRVSALVAEANRRGIAREDIVGNPFTMNGQVYLLYYQPVPYGSSQMHPEHGTRV